MRVRRRRGRDVRRDDGLAGCLRRVGVLRVRLVRWLLRRIGRTMSDDQNRLLAKQAAIFDQIADRTPSVEWLVARYNPATSGPLGGLSLHQCPECCALVLDDFLADHREWHKRLP